MLALDTDASLETSAETPSAAQMVINPKYKRYLVQVRIYCVTNKSHVFSVLAYNLVKASVIYICFTFVRKFNK